MGHRSCPEMFMGWKMGVVEGQVLGILVGGPELKCKENNCFCEGEVREKKKKKKKNLARRELMSTAREHLIHWARNCLQDFSPHKKQK